MPVAHRPSALVRDREAQPEDRMASTRVPIHHCGCHVAPLLTARERRSGVRPGCDWQLEEPVDCDGRRRAGGGRGFICHVPDLRQGSEQGGASADGGCGKEELGR